MVRTKLHGLFHNIGVRSLIALLVISMVTPLLSAQISPKKVEALSKGGIIPGLSNTDPTFNTYPNTPSSQLDYNALTEPNDRADNGDSPQEGQFRTRCIISHFAYDDPIVYPGSPGEAHLHMFFGNTKMNANTTKDSLVNSGGSSCQGGELNRTGYWAPTVHDAQGRIKVPNELIIYYKSKAVGGANKMPQGLELLAGSKIGTGKSYWSCGPNGFQYNVSDTIPQCPDWLNASIIFPQCWDGKNLGSSDHISHVLMIEETPTSQCPSSHPYRMPQISVLLYWQNPGDTSGWYLSSDRHNGATAQPGTTLHSDWWGGWNDQAQDIWIQNCVKAGRNCANGQTSTDRNLRGLNGPNLINKSLYTGETTLTLPAGYEPGNGGSGGGNTGGNTGGGTTTVNKSIAVVGDSLSHQYDAWIKIRDGLKGKGWENVAIDVMGCRSIGPPAGCGATDIDSLAQIIEKVKNNSFQPTLDFGASEGNLNSALREAGTIVINLGVNDSPADANSMEAKIRTAVAGLRNLNPNAQIYWTRVCSLQNTVDTGNAVNSALDKVKSELNLKLIDWASNCKAEYLREDGLHYFENGAQAYADTIAAGVGAPSGSSTGGNTGGGTGGSTGGGTNTGNQTSSTIKIRARGNQGVENMDLQINGATVRSFQNVSKTATDYTYTVNQRTTIDSIRVAFTNDDNVEGELDRYIDVDYIEIDGTRYESEAPTSRSLGVWSDAAGCAEGYKQGSWIVCNGWIQYEAAKGKILAPNAGGGASTGTDLKCSTTQPLLLAANADVASDYNIWVRVNQRSGRSSNNLYVGSGNQCSSVQMGTANSWQWRKSTGIVSLPQGAQNLALHLSDGQVWVDKVLVTADDNCVPNDATASSCVSTPIELTLNGIQNNETLARNTPVKVAAEAKGISANGTVTFTIDGKAITGNRLNGGNIFCLGAVANNACGTWDPSTLADGSHTIVVKAADETRQVSLSRSFKVGSQATPPPETGPVPDSKITVRALGNQGVENMDLILNGKVVKSWTNVAKTWTNYDYYVPTATTISSLRVAFTNDDEVEGPLDRYLLVDYVDVDGTKYQTESPKTRSLGIWTASTGCSEGYKQLELIACMGWAEYEEAKGTKLTDPTAPRVYTSSVKIRARGYTGQEHMNLSINGKVVANFAVNSVQPTTYEHTITDPTTIDNIRVYFTDNAYLPNGADKNIDLDYIEIDGKRYETEASTVYSQGIWTNPTQCSPGFKKSQFLACNGFAEYRDAAGTKLATAPTSSGSSSTASSKIVVRAQSNQNVENMDLILNGKVVKSWSGVSKDWADYSYFVDSGIKIDSLRVAFTNDDNVEGSADRYLVVDYVSVNGTRYQTDAATVRSQGVWTQTTGCAEGYKKVELIACNGWVEYEALKGSTTKATAALNTTFFAAPVAAPATLFAQHENHGVPTTTSTTGTDPMHQIQRGNADDDTTLSAAGTALRDSSTHPVLILDPSAPPRNSIYGTVQVLIPQKLFATENSRATITLDGEELAVVPASQPGFLLDTSKYEGGEHTLNVTVRMPGAQEISSSLTLEINNSAYAGMLRWMSNHSTFTLLVLLTSTAILVYSSYRLIEHFRAEKEEAEEAAGNPPRKTAHMLHKLNRSALVTTVFLSVFGFAGMALAAQVVVGDSVFSSNANILLEAEVAKINSNYPNGVDNTVTPLVSYVDMTATNSTTNGGGTGGGTGGNTGGGTGGNTGGGTGEGGDDFGSTIEIRARGFTGAESMQLKINDEVVRTWNNLSTSMSLYNYYPVESVTADKVSIHFTNDGMFNGQDMNLQVDYVEVDGLKHQSEDPKTFSEGSWTSATGCDPGYKLNEVLGCANAFFNYETAKGSVLVSGTGASQNGDTTGGGSNGGGGNGGSTGGGTGGGVPPATTEDYKANLAAIKNQTVRNRNEDNSAFRNTPSANLPVESLYGPRSEYLNNPAGNPEQDFPIPEGGQFRTACEFSHFAYDDPLVYPNQPGKAHLHMFFGNTDINAFSTYESVINSGSATCNGKELNRTGYWAPAMFDGAGNVRIPERVVVYYKGEGLANGNSIPYPERAAFLANQNGQDVNATNNGQGGAAGKFSFVCSDQYSGNGGESSNTMVSCDGNNFINWYGDQFTRVVLEMNVKFMQCWNGADPSDFRNNYRLPAEGSWYFSLCNGQFNRTLPNLEYFVNYPVEHGENTNSWFLSSDVNPATLVKDRVSGSTVHGDWWGGWNKTVNETFINNCVNSGRGGEAQGCGFGYLSNGGPDGNNPRPGPALKYRQQWTGPNKVPASQIYNELCFNKKRQYTTPTSAAYCNP